MGGDQFGILPRSVTEYYDVLLGKAFRGLSDTDENERWSGRPLDSQYFSTVPMSSPIPGNCLPMQSRYAIATMTSFNRRLADILWRTKDGGGTKG